MNCWILAAAANQTTPGAGGLQMLLMLIPFAVLYVILILPQRKKQKQYNEMLKSLKKGDKVITVGGIHGEIIDIDEEDIRLRVADKMELRFIRSAVQRIKK